MSAQTAASGRTVLDGRAKQPNSFASLLRNRNFTLLWIGQGTSLLGDQFYLIALPWLVLKLTGDPLALGAVLALAGIPRALFMLVGGAVTDRFSPRTIMLLSDGLRLVLTLLLAILVLTGATQIWMLYGMALLLGLVSGFFVPASGSILPKLIDKEELQPGNALTQGTAQLSMFAGPVLAGALIALFGNGANGSTSTPGMLGIALAFGFDALTFLVSIITLWLMHTPAPIAHADRPQAVATLNVLEAIRDGIAYVWNDASLRVMVLIIAAINFLFVGPLLVGIPVLADTRLAEGAAAFGIIMSAYGGGNLLGIVLAGALPRPRPQMMGAILIGVIALFGVGSAILGFVYSTWLAFAALLVMGVGNGYVSITMITLLQRRTPPTLLGRLMSLISFANVGLVPVSQALSGALIKLSIGGLFAGAGLLIVLVAAGAVLVPQMRTIGEDMSSVTQ